METELATGNKPALPIPGVDSRAAKVVVAGIGWDTIRFPTAGHPAPWAGLSRAIHDSAGKRQRNGRAPPGIAWLETGLAQLAWAAFRARCNHPSKTVRRIGGIGARSAWLCRRTKSARVPLPPVEGGHDLTRNRQG